MTIGKQVVTEMLDEIRGYFEKAAKILTTLAEDPSNQGNNNLFEAMRLNESSIMTLPASWFLVGGGHPLRDIINEVIEPYDGVLNRVKEAQKELGDSELFRSSLADLLEIRSSLHALPEEARSGWRSRNNVNIEVESGEPIAPRDALAEIVAQVERIEGQVKSLIPSARVSGDTDVISLIEKGLQGFVDDFRDFGASQRGTVAIERSLESVCDKAMGVANTINRELEKIVAEDNPKHESLHRAIPSVMEKIEEAHAVLEGVKQQIFENLKNPYEDMSGFSSSPRSR